MKPYLRTKDYFYTQQEFNLLFDEKLEMLKTNPVPDNLHEYYPEDSYLSHSDSGKSFFEGLYQFVKKLNIKNKLRLVKSETTHQGSLLDIGCGTGEFLFQAKNSGWHVEGVEPNPKARELSIQKGLAVTEKLDEVQINRYDSITLWHVLEHMPDLDEVIKTIFKLLKDDGALIVAVPNFYSFDAQYYKSHWAGYDVPRHLWHFTRTAIEKKFAGHGFKLSKTKPMWFDAFYVSILSEKYKKSTFPFLKGIAVGLWSNVKAMKTKEHSSIIYVLKKGHF